MNSLEYYRALEVRQNAFALDPETLEPWYKETAIFDFPEKKRRGLIARAAIDSQLSILTTSQEDVATIVTLLTLKKSLE